MAQAPERGGPGRRPGGALTNRDDLKKLRDQMADDLSQVKTWLKDNGGALTNESELKKLRDQIERQVSGRVRSDQASLEKLHDQAAAQIAKARGQGGKRPGGALTNKDDLKKLRDEMAEDFRGLRAWLKDKGGALTDKDDLKKLSDGMARDLKKAEDVIAGRVRADQASLQKLHDQMAADINKLRGNKNAPQFAPRQQGSRVDPPIPGVRPRPVAAASPVRPATPATPRPATPATPATPRPATPATPGRPAAPAAPVRAGAAPAAPRAGVPAAPAVGAPTTRPAAPAASGSPNAPATAAKPSAAVDAQVRQMFGEVAAFLTDPELGPLLRKAATEGWDSSRLMGALQQTKFWKTKGDAERKWIILNKLDNATAKTQVQSQMQAITDLARNEGVTLSGLQVHDLAVNVLKFGWSGSQVRENIFKAVPAAGLTTAVTQKYGYLASFMSNPEVGPLLQRGAREGWDAARLEAELQGTNFWKTTTDSQRRFNAQQTQDPGSAQQAIAQRTSQLQTTANGLGIRMDPARLGQIAKDSLAFGWDDSQVRQALAAEYDYQGSEFGFAGQTARQLKQIAADYLVPMSPQAMEKWTEDVVSGRIDEEGFRSYAVEQAKSQFPSLGAALDRGVTVAQYADPYKQIAARELELNPEQIDLNDPKWRAMLDTKDAKGQRVAMTLSEAQEYLRKRPEWQQTRGANERAASLTENLLRTFGATA